MKKQLFALGLVAVIGTWLCGVGFSHEHGDDHSDSHPHIHFVNAKGKDAGWVDVTETAQGVLIHVEAKGLKKGWHGIHLHAAGICECPDFKSAGGHFNPMGTQHGFESGQGPHIGDLPNIWVNSKGEAKAEIFAAHTTLKAGAKHSLADADGTALVIHEKADDYSSQPSGDSGDRVACAALPRQ